MHSDAEKANKYKQIKNDFEERGYELLSAGYFKISEKLPYICRKHLDAGVQLIDYYHFLRGQGCCQCRKEKPSKKRIPEDELRQICDSKNFTYVGVEYTVKPGCKSRSADITFICNNHPQYGEQRMPLGNLKRVSKGCKYCCGRNFAYKEIVSDIENMHPHIKVISREKHAGRYTYICLCRKHNTKFVGDRTSIINGHSCYYCGLEKLSVAMTKTHESYKEDLKRINPHLELVSKYNNARDKVICRCLLHNEVFERDAYSLLARHSGCKQCYKDTMIENQALDADEINARIAKNGYENVSLVGVSLGINKSAKFVCEKCNRTWEDVPKYVITRGCANCNKSSVENKIALVLDGLGVRYERQYVFTECKDKRSLPFDFYLPEHNTVIEYDGEQHFYPVNWSGKGSFNLEDVFAYTKKHDAIKNQFCFENNIFIIRISFWEKAAIRERLLRELTYKLTA